MDDTTLRSIIAMHLSGASQRQIGSQLSLSKSAVQGHLARLRPEIEAKMVAKQALDLDQLVALGNRRATGIHGKGTHPVDYEAIYADFHRRGKKHKTLKSLWAAYRESVPAGAVPVGYKGFCKGFARYCENLPPAIEDLALTNNWSPAELALIDYSGDPLFYVDAQTGERHAAQVFVGVLGNSGYIFCYATPGQTRVDWLDAQARMFEFFGGVPRQVFLDNSTPLVRKADAVDPVLSEEYEAFCAHYGVIPVAVRPGKPKDKALAENAVKQCQARIVSPLASRQFFDIASINKAIDIELRELNGAPLSNRGNGVSRTSLFEDERPFLAPLPIIAYEPEAIWKTLKVRKDYLIRYKNRRYSVPSQYVGKMIQVVVRPHAGVIEAFDKKTGGRIAKHYLRLPEGTTMAVNLSHMPAAHRAILASADELVDGLKACGIKTGELAAAVAKHSPGERGKKLLRGMAALRRRIGDASMEECCARTLEHPQPSYRTLVEIVDLVEGLEPKRTVAIGAGRVLEVSSGTKNLRGAEYYRQIIANAKEMKR